MKVILDGMNYTVGAKGQVVIPKKFRDALKIHPGQEVVFERRDDELVVRKATARPLKGRFPSSLLTDALLAARREDLSIDEMPR